MVALPLVARTILFKQAILNHETMKTITIILLLAFALTGFAKAATLTIDIPTADVPRIQEAFGSIYNLGRPATQTDIENAVRAWLRDSTQDYERRKNMVQFSPPPVTFTPAPTATP
jgi:hypothetical protein